MIPPVPCEPTKTQKKGKSLPDVIMVMAISCKAVQRGGTQIGACSGRKEEHGFSQGCWPGYPCSLAASIVLAVIWHGEGDPGWLWSEGWENLGAQIHGKTDLVPRLAGQLVHYFKNQFRFLPQIKK